MLTFSFSHLFKINETFAQTAALSDYRTELTDSDDLNNDITSQLCL